jgi:hypothetical protein
MVINYVLARCTTGEDIAGEMANVLDTTMCTYRLQHLLVIEAL